MKNKKRIGTLLLILGCLPFAVVAGFGIYHAIVGFSGLSIAGPAVYGFAAFMDFVILASYLYWPAYLVGAVLIAAGIVVLRKKK